MLHETIRADDGEQIHVHVSGSGNAHPAAARLDRQPCLLGSPGGAAVKHYRLLRPDARAHGGHALTVNHEPDVKRLARDLINLLDHFEIERIAAVGHSMGALTLWQCLQDFGTARFSHLAFIDQSPKLMTDDSWHAGIYGDFDSARAQRFIDDLEADFVEAVLRLIAFGLNDKARETYLRNSSGWRAARDALRNINPQSAIAIWKSLVAADYRDVLPTIDVPTLLAYGTSSNFYPGETARFVASRTAPQANLSLYEGADHGPHLLQPDRFTRELVELINGSVAWECHINFAQYRSTRWTMWS